MEHQQDPDEQLMSLIVHTALQLDECDIDLDELFSLLTFVNETYEGKFDIQLARLKTEIDHKSNNCRKLT